MHVISTFEHSAYLELAINKLQENGIDKENIVAIPLENIMEPAKIFDTIHRADGISLLDVSAVMGTIFSVLGASIGFVLKWGPIIWGLIGLALGAILGFIIDFCIGKNRKKKTTNLNSEVVLIVLCKEIQFQMVKNILKEYMSLGIGQLKI
jgi:hypothetical protein